MTERRRRTERQRAEEALHVAERRHVRALAAKAKAEEAVGATLPEIHAAADALAYARQHPALRGADEVEQP